MKNNLIDRFNKNEKWKDYINFKSFECQAALFFSIIMIIVIKLLDVYNQFDVFLISFQNITLYIAQAFIGMIGFILAGVAIVLSVLNKETIRRVEDINGKGTVEKVLLSFEFLAFNIGISIVLFFLLYLILNSHNKLIHELPFNVTVFLTSYIFIFIVFYAISLIRNCTQFFLVITTTYESIIENDKNIIEAANEIRIDFILNTLIQDSRIDKEEFLFKLNEYVDSSNFKDKDMLKKYLTEYYS